MNVHFATLHQAVINIKSRIATGHFLGPFPISNIGREPRPILPAEMMRYTP